MPATTKAVAPTEINLSAGHTDEKQLKNFRAISADGNIKKYMYFEATVNVGNLVDAAGETVQLTGCTGVALGDVVIGVSLGVDMLDMLVTAYVQAANVIELRVQNESGNTVNLDSTKVRVIVADVT